MNLVMGEGGDGLSGQIKVFETATGKEVSTLTGPVSIGAIAQSLEFSPDATRVAVSYRLLRQSVRLQSRDRPARGPRARLRRRSPRSRAFRRACRISSPILVLVRGSPVESPCGCQRPSDGCADPEPRGR